MALKRAAAPMTATRLTPVDATSALVQFETGTPVERRAAIRMIAGAPGASAHLARRISLEPDRSVREAIFAALASIGDHEAVDGLVACLRSEDVAVRNEAISAMQRLPDAVADIIDGLLVDGDPDVRIFAVNVLESLQHPDVERWLLAVIEGDEHVNVCGTAIDLLAEVGTPRALAPLARVKARFPREPYMQFAVDVAVRRINGTDR